MTPAVLEGVLPRVGSSSVAGNNLFSLANKTVAITGGARGLGLNMATAAAESGANVACIDILEEPPLDDWAQLQEAASANNVTISYHCCDVTAEKSIEDVLESICADAETYGAPFSGMVAAAGITQLIPALEYPAADFDRVMRVNVTGVFNTCKHTAKIWRRMERTGSIVIIASISGSVANRGLPCTAYNASKAATLQMCRSLAQEWGPFGIRINTISPGYIRTAMTDQLIHERPDVEKIWKAGALLDRLGTPDDLKAPAVFLLSDGAAFVHGMDLKVDGGQTASV